MILSNTEIHKAIDDKRLIITPEPLPRVPTIGKDCPYDTHAVDLKLHDEISVPTTGKYCIDLSNPGSIVDVITDHSRKVTISMEQPFRLEHGQFILARTLEKVSLPIQENEITLAARIEGKSSRARFGLIVHCAAPTVHPGFNGSLTLEVANLGPNTFLLSPEMHIAQLIIEEVKGKITSNPSSFQYQNTATGKRQT